MPEPWPCGSGRHLPFWQVVAEVGPTELRGMRVELQRGGGVIMGGVLKETFAAVTVTLKVSVVVTYTVGGIEST